MYAVMPMNIEILCETEVSHGREVDFPYSKLLQRFKDLMYQQIVKGKPKMTAHAALEKDFRKNIKSSAIMLEGASMHKYQASSWADMESNVIRACESISRAINTMEQKQSNNLKDLERYTNQATKRVNGSAIPEYDGILRLILYGWCKI